MRLPRLIIRGNRMIASLLSLAIFLPLVILAWEVFMRYVAGAPTIWVHQSATALIAASFIFGGILAAQDHEHVGLSAHEWFMPAAWQWWRYLVVQLIVLTFLAVLSYALVEQAYRSVLVWETSGLVWRAPIPMIIKLAMAVGSTLFTLDLALRLIMHVSEPREKELGSSLR